jgi:hypothetical protein
MLKVEAHVATEQTRASCWNYHLLAIWSPILSLLAIMTRASVGLLGPPEKFTTLATCASYRQRWFARKDRQMSTLSAAWQPIWWFTLLITESISAVTRLILLSSGAVCCPPVTGPFCVGGTHQGEHRKPPQQDADEQSLTEWIVARPLSYWLLLWYTSWCWEELRGNGEHK